MRKQTKSGRFLSVGLMTLLLLMVCGLIQPVYAQSDDCEKDRHRYVEINRRPATQTEDGSVSYQCELCEDTYLQLLYATGHRWDEWITQREPTCTQPGLRSRTCHVGVTHIETQEIPVTAHRYEETVKEATCTGKGETISTCSLCGDSYQEELPALVHRFGGWITEKPAAEGENGLRFQACALCGERNTEVLPALPAAPIEEKPFFGTQERVLAGTTVSIWTLFALLLRGEFVLLIWERRKKKIVLERLKKEDDGYESV